MSGWRRGSLAAIAMAFALVGTAQGAAPTPAPDRHPQPQASASQDETELYPAKMRVPGNALALLRRGVLVEFTCAVDCTVEAQLLISERDRRKLGLEGAVIGELTGEPLSAGVPTTLRIWINEEATEAMVRTARRRTPRLLLVCEAAPVPNITTSD